MATQPDLKPTDNVNYKIEGDESRKFPVWKLSIMLASIFAISAIVYFIIWLIK